MTRDRAIVAALRQVNLSNNIIARQPLSGGCIFNVESLTLDTGTVVVAKSGNANAEGIFREESAGLEAIAATGTVQVPTPLGSACVDGHAVLLLSYISPGHADRNAWQTFAGDLARLHMCDVGRRYGFDHDNHIGATPQPNRYMDDWVEFNRTHRIGYQLKLADTRDLLNADEVKRFEQLCDRLADFLPRQPKPSLLHGDLWSGNALATEDGRIALIDPAVSIGDGWADIAMMKLFGGFPQVVFDTYSQCINDEDRIDQRIAVYQLYHVLNHVNLFGRGYVSQALRLAHELGC